MTDEHQARKSNPFVDAMRNIGDRSALSSVRRNKFSSQANGGLAGAEERTSLHTLGYPLWSTRIGTRLFQCDLNKFIGYSYGPSQRPFAGCLWRRFTRADYDLNTKRSGTALHDRLICNHLKYPNAQSSTNRYFLPHYCLAFSRDSTSAHRSKKPSSP